MLRFKGAAAMALLLLTSAGACAAAKVTYVNAEKMTDVPRFASELEAMEAAFSEHIETLAAKLPAGQELTVEFLDIDLAGEVFTPDHSGRQRSGCRR
jgi:Skp family chaperone for outer membrane proteins